MSRLTVGNILKVTIAVLFFILLPLLVLMIGVRRKNRTVILEGAIYVALFLIAVAIPADSALSTLSAFAFLLVIAVSAVRSYMLRDLWLHPKVQGSQRIVGSQQDAPIRQVPYPSPAGAPTAPSTQDLSQSLSWVASLAKQNKNRLPADAYVSVLETCQTLDAVIDAETRQPMGDPQFEYELTATVREYLPAVIRGYLAVPPSVVDNRQANGRTANEELVEQLELLARQADTLHSSRHRQTSMDLANTGNFLRERFGHHKGGDFDFGIK